VRCRQSWLVGKPDGRLAQGILITLGQPYCMLDLLETLRSEEDRPRTVSALVDAGGGQREQRDQRE
jgi:hypothetical protein